MAEPVFEWQAGSNAGSRDVAASIGWLRRSRKILITDPGAILQSLSGLPIGYWRGSGLALILDLLATLLSAGQSTQLIAKQESEYAVSQVFLAIEVTTLTGKELLKQTVEGIIRDFPWANPLSETEQVRYPGEDMMRTRKESLEFGVLVDENQ